jgi:hypothetical protein
VTVPAAARADEPQLGAVRFSWEVKTSTLIRLKAALQHQIGNSQEMTDFEVPLSVVSPLIVAPVSVPLEDLNYNDRRDIFLFAWSATRPSIKIHVDKRTPSDACVEVGEPVPLTEQDRRFLPALLQRQGQLSSATRMLCGYSIKVTVFERRGDQQLDLGPLARRLTVKLDNGSGPDESVDVTITGTVRGVIQVGDAKDRDRIDLGTFKANRPFDKTIQITSTDPNIGLRLAGKSPESMHVELKEQPGGFGNKRWTLHLEVEPNTFSGFLPTDASVILETVGNSTRRIRIPVAGIAIH